MGFIVDMSFIVSFFHEVNTQMKEQDTQSKLSTLHIKFLSTVMSGILVTKKLSWASFERHSLGRYTKSGLSWLFRHAGINWTLLFTCTIKVILKLYGIRSGILVADDTDRQRSKKTSVISYTHKIYDKKTSGFFNGQNIVFLLLVTDKITIPVDFVFYKPDPTRSAWIKENKRQIKQGIPKKDRPLPPPYDPNYPTRIQLVSKMLASFLERFPNIKIEGLITDAAFFSADFFKELGQKYPNLSVTTKIKKNQKVQEIIKNKDDYCLREWTSTENFFKDKKFLETELLLRGVQKKVHYQYAHVKLRKSSLTYLLVAIKYEKEQTPRYIIIKNSNGNPLQAIQNFAKRWLIEVFFQDWKAYEGWGQKSLQRGDEGACRGIILSLLLDLCLLSHPDQIARNKHSQPVYTLGSLSDFLVMESQWIFLKDLLLSGKLLEGKLDSILLKIKECFLFRESRKHFSGVIKDPDPPPDLEVILAS